MQYSHIIENCSTWVIGRGNKVRFWQDTWFGNTNFQTHFPSIFAIARDKYPLVESAFEGNLSFTGNVVVSRNLQDRGLEEYMELNQILSTIQLRNRDDRLNEKLNKKVLFLSLLCISIWRISLLKIKLFSPIK